jgi:hypothetical protein
MLWRSATFCVLAFVLPLIATGLKPFCLICYKLAIGHNKAGAYAAYAHVFIDRQAGKII